LPRRGEGAHRRRGGRKHVGEYGPLVRKLIAKGKERIRKRKRGG